MPEKLPLRAARPAARYFAASLVAPDGVDLEALASTDRLVIYVGHWSTRLDERILRASLAGAGLRPPRWVGCKRRRTDEARLRQAFLAGDPVLVPLSPRRSGADRLARLLTWARESDLPVDLVPLETHWGPQGRPPSTWNVLFAGNPYDPPRWLRWLRVRDSRRLRVLMGAPGTLAALTAQAPRPDDALALSSFVRGQATKALSHAERHYFGDRYKVPRFVVEDVLSEAHFRDAIAATGANAGLTREEALARAENALRELVTGHNPFHMELFSRFCRWLYTRVYDPEIQVDPAELEKLRELGKTSSLVFVPGHKSNLDHLLLYDLLYRAGFPPPHTAAGNNMSFFPMSRILPGTGAYFIRRSFQDDPIYKEAFGAFIQYLVERRFHQEFFIEGGRTRSGKPLPPRYGMLRYLVDAARRSDVHDARIVPTSLTYDQVYEVSDYVRELRGGEKERESFGFLLRVIRSLRSLWLGRMYVRFGEPIALAEHLARSGDDKLVVERLAFQVLHDINEGTRLTALSVVCSALLGAGRRALTRGEIVGEIGRVIEFARQRGIPIARELEEGVDATLEAGLTGLRAAHWVESYDRGLETVFHIPAEGRHAASYYRNTTIHFFLIRAIARLALLAVKKDDVPDAKRWALRIRELLKFEFFFSPREVFLAEFERERQSMERESERGLRSMYSAGPSMLVDYFESYLVVVEALQSVDPAGPAVPLPELLKRCQAIGQQLLLQRRVHAPELLSNSNFQNGLELAANLGAAQPDPEGYRPGAPAVLAPLLRDLEELARLAQP